MVRQRSKKNSLWLSVNEPLDLNTLQRTQVDDVISSSISTHHVHISNSMQFLAVSMRQTVAQQCDEIRNLNENKIPVCKVFVILFTLLKQSCRISKQKR